MSNEQVEVDSGYWLESLHRVPASIGDAAGTGRGSGRHD
jgi:hypothetical protein